MSRYSHTNGQQVRPRAYSQTKAQAAQVAGYPSPHSQPHCAGEVEHYASKTLDLIVRWIHRAETDPAVPACKWENSAHLRRIRETRSHTQGNGAGAGATLATAQAQLSDHPIPEEALFAFLQQTLEDSVNPWTHRFLDKLYTIPTPSSPALELMLGALNASGVVSSASPALCLAEEEAVEGLARLMGWNVATVDGLTMPGGSASNVLAVQTALGNAFPTFKTQGLWGVSEHLMGSGRSFKGSRPVILTSEQSHYSIEKAALACGLGLQAVRKVRCDAQGRMRLDHLEEVLEQSENAAGRDADEAGFPFFINITSGTTILGAFDDIRAVAATVRKFTAKRASRNSGLGLNGHRNGDAPDHSIPDRIWIHVDASWGGPVLFSSKLRKLMDGVEEVDSLTINPHKVLNVTQQCSFALFKRATDLALNVTGAKYLFHGSSSPSSDAPVDPRVFLRRNPGAKTMGCGRRPDAFKFYFEWLRVGTIGFGTHVERGVSYALETVRLIQEKYSATLEVAESTLAAVKSGSLFLQVCFRPRMPQALVDLLSDGPRHTDVQNGTHGNVNGSAHGNGNGKSLLSPSVAAYTLLSHSVHTLHSQLRAVGRFTVDKAPLSHPHPDVGYFIRLVTHPTTPIGLFEELVGEVDRLGLEYFEQVQDVIRGGIEDADLDGQARKLKSHVADLKDD